MSAVWTIVKKELARTFLNRRNLVATIIMPGLVLFVVYSLMGQMDFVSVPKEEDRYQVVLTTTDPNFNLVFADNEQFIITTKDSSAEFESEVANGTYQLGLVVDRLLTGYGIEQWQISYFYDEGDEQSKNALLAFQMQLSLYTVDAMPYQFVAINNVNEKVNEGITVLSIIFPMLIVMMLLAGAMNAVADSIAGEKERQTIGLLVMTQATKMQIAVAKVFANVIISIASAASSFIGIVMSMTTSDSFFGVTSGLTYQASDYTLMLMALLGGAFVIVAGLCVMSAFAKTTKEAAMLSLPVYIVALVLSLSATIGNNPLGIAGWFIPLYNTSHAIKSVFVFNLDIPMFLVSLGVNIAAFIALVFAINYLFKKERVLF